MGSVLEAGDDEAAYPSDKAAQLVITGFCSVW